MKRGIGGHQSSKSGSDIWITPLPIINALGGPQSFDLDPCAATDRPWDTARNHFNIHDNGLLKAWHGRVWLNPPYSRSLIGKFMGRMADHGDGIALTFARTEMAFFHRFVWPVADAILFLEGRVTFHHEDGSTPIWDGGAPSVLIGYGSENADALAGCGIKGAFVPLRWKAFFVGFKTVSTWMEIMVQVMKEIGDSVTLADLYRKLASHPKAKRNPNYQAKIRQILQAGPFERVGRGEWKLL